MTAAQTVLAVTASARSAASKTRQGVTALADRYAQDGAQIITRDLAANPPAFVDEAWVEANFTAPEKRTATHTAVLETSDTLVAELEAADVIIIGAPIYNFSVPGALKAWIDQVARVRRTFRYTADGPEGLLKNKRAVIVVASGGTAIGSDYDFATGYLRHILGFLGIVDVEIVAADTVIAEPAV